MKIETSTGPLPLSSPVSSFNTPSQTSQIPPGQHEHMATSIGGSVYMQNFPWPEPNHLDLGDLADCNNDLLLDPLGDQAHQFLSEIMELQPQLTSTQDVPQMSSSANQSLTLDQCNGMNACNDSLFEDLGDIISLNDDFFDTISLTNQAPAQLATQGVHEEGSGAADEGDGSSVLGSPSLLLPSSPSAEFFLTRGFD